MTGSEFAQAQEALLYVFYPFLTWFLAMIVALGFVAGLTSFFLELATPKASDD